VCGTFVSTYPRQRSDMHRQQHLTHRTIFRRVHSQSSDGHYRVRGLHEPLAANHPLGSADPPRPLRLQRRQGSSGQLRPPPLPPVRGGPGADWRHVRAGGPRGRRGRVGGRKGVGAEGDHLWRGDQGEVGLHVHDERGRDRYREDRRRGGGRTLRVEV